jgi:hypothetical protein
LHPTEALLRSITSQTQHTARSHACASLVAIAAVTVRTTSIVAPSTRDCEHDTPDRCPTSACRHHCAHTTRCLLDQRVHVMPMPCRAVHVRTHTHTLSAAASLFRVASSRTASVLGAARSSSDSSTRLHRLYGESGIDVYDTCAQHRHTHLPDSSSTRTTGAHGASRNSRTVRSSL